MPPGAARPWPDPTGVRASGDEGPAVKRGDGRPLRSKMQVNSTAMRPLPPTPVSQLRARTNRERCVEPHTPLHAPVPLRTHPQIQSFAENTKGQDFSGHLYWQVLNNQVEEDDCRQSANGTEECQIQKSFFEGECSNDYSVLIGQVDNWKQVQYHS